MKCEACGIDSNESQVCSSSLGPVSFCYCPACLKMNAEPLSIIHAVVENMNSINDLAEWARTITFFDNREYHSIEEVFTNPLYKAKPIDYPSLMNGTGADYEEYDPSFDPFNTFNHTLNQNTVEEIAKRLLDKKIIVNVRLTNPGWVGMIKSTEKFTWSLIFPDVDGVSTTVHSKHFETLLDLYLAVENEVNSRSIDEIYNDPTIRNIHLGIEECN